MAKTMKISGEKGARLGKQAGVGCVKQVGGRLSRKSPVRQAGMRLVKRVGAEVEANFRAWLTRNFVNPRAGRIGGMSYDRAGALDDRVGDGEWYMGAYDRAWADYSEPATPEELAYIVAHPLIALQLAVGVSDLRGLRCLRRGLTQRVNALQKRSYRSRYYARDNARRRLLAAERRKITRRRTLNPCPTPEEFRAAFARVGESVAAKIRFGGLVHDLECYVDNCLRIDGRGEIVGRNGGIKAWIADNVPELYGRYKTVMRYKALARRVRQATGVEDPIPTGALLEGLDGNFAALGASKRTLSPETPTSASGNGNSGDENYYAFKSHSGRVREARRRVAEMFSGCPNTAKDAFDRVDAALSELEKRLAESAESCPAGFVCASGVRSSSPVGDPCGAPSDGRGVSAGGDRFSSSILRMSQKRRR